MTLRRSPPYVAGTADHLHTKDFSNIDLDWKPAVAAFLDGKATVMTMEVVRGALGRTYDQMNRDDWSRLADAIMTLGWTKRKLGKGSFVGID